MDWHTAHHPAYWGGKQLAYPHVSKESPKFAQCVAVGNLIFASGFVGQDMSERATPPPADIEAQVMLALDNAKRALEKAGGTMDNVVKTFFLIKSLDDYPKVRKAETEFYEKHAPELIGRPPAATLMVVPSLGPSEWRAQYEVIGVRDRTASDWGVTYYPEFWGGRELAYPHVPKEHAKFARTQTVGDLVIVSGCQALDHDSVRVETDDVEEQSRIVLEKIKIGMEETGGSLATLAKTNVFVKDQQALRLYRQTERAFFKENLPAWSGDLPASTAFIVKELPRPEFLIEVEAFGITGAHPADWPLSRVVGDDRRAAAVRAGNLLFVSGCDATDPENGDRLPQDIEGQVRAALDKLRHCCETAGGSMNGILKTTLMLKRVEDYPAMARAQTDYFEKHAPGLIARPPASTFMQLEQFQSANALFELDATAVI